MTYRTAKTSLSIRILTAIILAMVAGFIVGGIYHKDLLLAGALLGVIALFCYLLAPVSYDVTDGHLTVVLRVGRISYGPVLACARLTERLPFTVRLFGNSGLFAGTGIFWNMRDGIFRVYATSAKPTDAVLVRTEKYKVLITPENPDAFVEGALLRTSDCGTAQRFR